VKFQMRPDPLADWAQPEEQHRRLRFCRCLENPILESALQATHRF